MQVLSAAPASVLSGAGTFQQGCDMTKPNDTQIGGAHYKGKTIQPWDYITANGIGYLEGNIIKYVSRWKDKGGVHDLEKARHYLDKLISLESQLGVEWIENTGVPPFNKGEIEYVLRDGTTDKATADTCDFAKTGRPSDIIRYRYI